MADLSREEIVGITRLGLELKAAPLSRADALANQTLLMMFNKPSLRTRLSFETGMTQLGGHAIYYDLAGQNLGTKESFYDTSRVSSSMVDVIMARVQSREEVRQLAAHSTVPVINALDDWAHPCQILADVLTLAELRPQALEAPADGRAPRLKWAYVGDVANNVTYDIMRGAAVLGHDVAVAGPQIEGYDVDDAVADELALLCETSGSRVDILFDAAEAVRDADVVYTDSWMSYHISAAEAAERERVFAPYRVTSELMRHAKDDALFLHCLPAQRGLEVDADVIDGPHSVVFPQAENRMHAQKALLLFLLGKM